jgi:hypothetical protein
MFAIIERIFDIISDELKPASIERRIKEHKTKELGTELFLLYISANKIIAGGHDIIGSLEIYTRMTRHISHGGDEYALTFNTFVGKAIIHQKDNIIKFAESAARLSFELDLVSAEAQRELRRLLSGKFNALNNLLEILTEGDFPVGSDEFLIPEADDFNDRVLKRLSIEARKVPMISYTKPWDENVFPKIESYIASHEPHDRLKRIEVAAETLKASLEKYFSVKDILLSIGDRRLVDSTKNYFWGH